ncbi:MAG TPA: YggT family protein [Methylomirabilota bacterium]|jgi:YggT family protein|nr:YggT family protein [Methylomirabilota bacterium]
MMDLVDIIMRLLDLYVIVIIAAALITWVQPNPYNPIVRFLRQITEPVLRPVRQLVPPEKLGGLDISPIIVIVIIRWFVPVILRALL